MRHNGCRNQDIHNSHRDHSVKKWGIEGSEMCFYQDWQVYIIPCCKLVLTAGLWTPSQVKTLFPDSPLDLQPSTNAGAWVIFQNKNPLNTKSTAVVFFDDILHKKLEYAGRNDGSIWVCGRRNYTAVLPRPGEEDEPDDEFVSDLIHYSRRFTRQSWNGDDESPRNCQFWPKVEIFDHSQSRPSVHQ